MAEDLERFDPAVQKGRLAYEHLHRYALCREWVEGLRVLDVACGTGYGTAVLGSVAASVTGLDISAESVIEARRRYGRENVDYVVGNCYDLPFDDDSFDVVVANEMIEHVEDHDKLIAQVKRVLRPDGRFLVSTPNKPVYNRYQAPNPFHVSELNLNDFETLLRRHFPHVRMIATRMMLSSVSFDLDRRNARANQATALIYSGQTGSNRIIQIENCPLDLDDPEYMLAACSLEPLEERFPGNSLFFSVNDDLWAEHERIMAWASGLHDEDEVLRAQLAEARVQVDDQRSRLSQALAEHQDTQSSLSDVNRHVETILVERDRLVEQARRDADKDWAALARYVELLVDEATEAGIPNLLKGLYVLNERHQRMQGEIAVLREQAEQRVGHDQASREAHENELSRARQEIEALHARLADMEQARRADERTHAELVGRPTAEEVRALEDRLSQSNQDMAAVRAELEDERSRARAREERLESLALERERLTAIGEAAQAQVRQSSDTVRETLNRAVRSEVQAGLVQERLDTALGENEDLRLLCDAAQAQARRSDEAARTSLDKVAQGETRVHLLQQRLQAARRSADEELATARQTARDHIDAARQAQNSALAQLEASQAMLDAARTRIERTDKALHSLRDRQEEMVTEHQATDAALHQARSWAAGLGERVEQVRQNLLRVFPKTRALSPREARSRDEFRALHRSVRNELANATRDMRHAAIPGPATPMRQLAGIPLPGGLRTCLFNRGWIARNHPELGNVTLWSYLRDRRHWSIDPHPLFDARHYREQRCEIDGRETSPLRHYIEKGWREGRDPHPWFSNDWYLHRNPDVLADATMTPLEHYLLHGWREGRRPNPLFDPAAYLDRYPDVRAADMEPLTHFIVHGLPEGRELPIRGITANARLWMPETDRRRPVIDFMLACDVPHDEPQVDVDALIGDLASATPAILPGAGGSAGASMQVAETPATWPPRPLHDYWPPQGLRDFVLERYDEAVLDRIWYLYSVMNAFDDGADAFPGSETCRQLVDHLRHRAAIMARATSGIPDVSIVIPVYNNILDTLLCVASVLDAETTHSFEIIVADDRSGDATADLIPSIGGCVRHVRHAENQGFLGNCNAAAAHANGRHVLLLNNDTLVMPHWLDALLEPFARLERVGLTGAKLINWDGSLQEAGGIYWNDGSAWNFGRNQAPRAPQFSYLKDVDYVSGAAICLPRAVWQEMDGFDTLFTPAYCEDSDLAFRLRAAGYRTVLAPEAEVIHHEGRSHGRDVDSGIKAYQVTNTARLLDRWRTVLARDHYPNAVNVLRARDRSFAKPHVLVVDHYVPQWDQDAGSRSTFNCIQAFVALGYSVTLWPDNLWRDPDYTPVYQAMGVEVIYGPEFQDGFADFVRDRSDLYDVAFVNRPHIAEPYIEALRLHTGTRIMFYGHDLHFQRLTRAMEVGEDVTLDAIETAREQELRICGKADVVFYPDQGEVDYVARAVGGRRRFQALPVVVYPTDGIGASAQRIQAQKTRQAGGPPGLLFVGGFNHTPNRDGIIWFVNEVLPIVRREVGPVRLTIVGSKPPKEVVALEGADVVVTGFLSDGELDQLYDHAALAIAPLRYGAGVKGKVIEALAKGVPLVTTPVGAQGLVGPETMLFLGSSAAEFASCVVRALRDPDDARRRASSGADYVRAHYSSEALQGLFKELVET